MASSPTETLKFQADLESQMFCTSSAREVETCSFPCWHRPAGRLATGVGAAHSSAPHRATSIQEQLLLFRAQHERPSCSALGTHQRAQEQRESPQPNSTGRKMRAVMGQHLPCGCTGRPSNNTPNGSPVLMGHPSTSNKRYHIVRKLLPLFAAQGALVTGFHKSESKCKVLLFQ